MDIHDILRDQKAFKQVAKSIFDQFDLDGNGVIDRNELAIALGQFSSSVGGPKVEDAIVDETMKELDKDNSNTLSIDEFELFVRKTLVQMAS